MNSPMVGQVKSWEYYPQSGYKSVDIAALQAEHDFNEVWRSAHKPGQDEAAPLVFVGYAHDFVIVDKSNRSRPVMPRFIYLWRHGNHVKVMVSQDRVEGAHSTVARDIVNYLNGLYCHGPCPEISEEHFSQLAEDRCLH